MQPRSKHTYAALSALVQAVGVGLVGLNQSRTVERRIAPPVSTTSAIHTPTGFDVARAIMHHHTWMDSHNHAQNIRENNEWTIRTQERFNAIMRKDVTKCP